MTADDPGEIQPGELPPAPPKGFLGRLKHFVLHPELAPEQIAWSFALGLSVAFNPLVGLHTVLVLAFCFAFRRLHMPLMFLGAFINNPWTMVPIATLEVIAGNLLRGHGLHHGLGKIPWHEITWRNFVSWAGMQELAEMLRPVLHSYLLGGFIFCLLAIPAGYWAMLAIVRRMRAAHFLEHKH
ncbi:MAG TPA: DUF2062 domain-containing protein [Holophagaceae bacterium]|jgi:uncharacterized protein (DUF2062 family)|nr:DUF2062 domain-containing protein [Holophagaceae bacterium]